MSCLKRVFSHLTKNQGLGRDLGNLGDGLN